jgi:hypothetical protein
MPEDRNMVVAVYKDHDDAEAAVKHLQAAGFDIRKISVVGRDYHTEENVIGYYNAGDRVKLWGKWGAFWGGMWGLLLGSAFLAVPGLGFITAAGPIVAWIAAALEGAVVVGGVSALGAALFSAGIPKNSILRYETALKADKFLVIAHGTAADVAKARDLIQTTQAEDFEMHTFHATTSGTGA